MTADTAGRMPPPARGWRSDWRAWLGVVAIVVIGTFAYAPALSGSWVWDDFAEITGNKLIQDPNGLPAIWRGAGTLDYFPLKTSLQWLQWRLWGANPFPYHVTNVALHLSSALLIWRLLRRLGAAAPAAWLGGMVFAVHPLTVESVAWIAEFKNAVSLPPLLLAGLAYIDFAERGGRRHYAAAFGWFLVSALCKTSVLMLPPVLLVYSWWRDNAVTRRALLSTAPFFALSAVLGAVTVWFQHSRAMGAWDIAPGGIVERLGRAGAAAVFYLGKAVFPVGLLPVYPRGVPAESVWAQLAAWLVVIALLAWCWRRRATWGRTALLGAGWFGLHLAPVLGVVSMAYMYFAWVADHFVYIPLIGVVGLAAAGWGSAWQRYPKMRAALVVASAIVLVLAIFATRRHAALFMNEETLWRYTLERNPSAWVGHSNLAFALSRQGRLAEAIEHNAIARELKPTHAILHVDAASYLSQLGRLEEALAAAGQAEALGGATAEMYSNLGAALLRAGRLGEPLAAYERALQLDPAHPKTHKDYGVALYLAGRTAEAVEHYERGLQTAPDAQTHTNCGVALAALDRLPDAMRHYEAALQLAPDSVDAHYNYGIALARSGRRSEAKEHFESVIRLNAQHAEAYFHLGEIHRAEGRSAEATRSYQVALQLRPQLAAAARRLEELRKNMEPVP